jgi:ribosome biogenesis GTPase A
VGKDERTIFQEEKRELAEKRRAEARVPVRPAAGIIEENGLFGVRSLEQDMKIWEEMGTRVRMPWRVEWDVDWGKDKLEAEEEKEFKLWIRDLHEEYGDRMNAFEHNLEVWRQLWRTIEMSDVLAIVVDARYPAFLFPFALYNAIQKERKIPKPVVMILNKVDIVSAKHVEEWKKYFNNKFPELKIVTFTSHARPEKSPKKHVTSNSEEYSESSEEESSQDEKSGYAEIMTSRRKGGKKKKTRMVSVGIKELLDACKESVLNFSEYANSEQDIMKCFDFPEKKSDDDSGGDASSEFSITIGFVGQPNAGKSSIINGLMNRSAVSVSRTPGHTKHFQTIYLNRIRRPENKNKWGWGLKLCDCPGLVFPLVDVSRTLQVVCGLYPLAQVKEPYSAVHFVAEHIPVPLHKIYKLKVPDEDDDVLDPLKNPDEFPWSGWTLCTSYAMHRGFKTAKAGRPDVYRAAICILKDVVDGKVAVVFLPPSEQNNDISQIDLEKKFAEVSINDGNQGHSDEENSES